MGSAAKHWISEDILNTVFLQTSPGYDRDTLTSIQTEFEFKPEVFVGLGRYDLVVIDERKDLSLVQKFYGSSLAHLKDWLPVWGLRWKVEKRRKYAFSSDDKILGLSFIKLDLDQVFQSKSITVEEEESLVEKIAAERLGASYCSLGFNELLVVNRTNSFRDLSKKVLSLKKALISNNTPKALDICTIPAVEYKTILDPNARKELNASLEVILFLSLQIGLDDRFRSFLKRITGDKGESIFGAHDIVLRLSGETGEIMHNIEKIRTEGAKYGLYSTHTMVTHPDIGLRFDVRTSESDEVLKHDIGASTISDERFNFYKTWIQASRRDPLTKHVFADQVDFFKGNTELETVVDDDPQAFDSILECVRIGFEQRCSSLHPGDLLGAKSIRTEHLGSLQRVTMAIESLPAFLFSSLDYGKWPGFCIHGYVNRFYRTEGGIINVPYKYRILPEMWWGILHEVGHEAFLRIEEPLKASLHDEIKEIIDSVTRAYRQEKAIDQAILEEDYTDFVEEIFAELFGFHFGFNDDWELYSNKVWSYFAKEMRPDHRHICRSVLAYFTFGPGKALFRDQITIEEIDKCVGNLEKITKRANKMVLYGDEWDNAISIVMTFLNIADIIRSNFMDKSAVYDCTRFDEIGDSLKRGLVFRSNNPLEILFAFVTGKFKPNCRRRVAAILSLYNCYCDYLRRSE